MGISLLFAKFLRCTHKHIEEQHRRLGVKNGAKRRPPPGKQAQRTSHPHRTHDTTDQWRDPRLYTGWFSPKTVVFVPTASSVP